MAGAVPAASAAADPLVGAVIHGRFRIQALIARGGMGKVYLAQQEPLGRRCAVKVLNPKYQGDEDPEFHRRFFLEASTAAKLTHPNTVTIYDYGRDGDIYFIAMEYIQGRTLYRVLREDGPLPGVRVARILRQVCRSLREAHALGVIHRDMKPANIVLTEHSDEADTIKVLDFGLVKEVTEDKEDLTQEGLFMGSPKYMAPEQILGNPVSPCTDVYSLGIVAYELLTGVVPFDRGASVKTLMAHVHEPPPPMTDVRPGVQASLELQSIVMRCLAKEPELRFENMDALLQALGRVEGGGGLTESLRAAPAVQPEVPWSRPFSDRPSGRGSGPLGSSGPRSGLGGVPVPLSPSGPVSPSGPPSYSGPGALSGPHSGPQSLSGPLSPSGSMPRIPGPVGVPEGGSGPGLFPSGTPAPIEQPTEVTAAIRIPSPGRARRIAVLSVGEALAVAAVVAAVSRAGREPAASSTGGASSAVGSAPPTADEAAGHPGKAVGAGAPPPASPNTLASGAATGAATKAGSPTPATTHGPLAPPVAARPATSEWSATKVPPPPAKPPPVPPASAPAPPPKTVPKGYKDSPY